MLETLDHIIIAVEDLDQAAASYETLLGRPASWTGGHPNYGTRNVLFRLENTYLELLTPAGDGQVADQLRAKIADQGEGPIGLAFGCRDAQAAFTRLTSAGLDPAAPVSGEGRNEADGALRRWRTVFLPEEKTGGLSSFVIEHQSPAEALPITAPPGPAGAAMNSVDHVVVRSKDADASIAFFGEPGLGLRLALDKTAVEWGGRMLFFRVGGVTVEVIAKLPEAQKAAATAAHTKGADAPLHRFWGVAYTVADIEAAQRRLAGSGVEISEVRQGRKPGTRVATVKSHVHGVPTLLIGPDDGALASG